MTDQARSPIHLDLFREKVSAARRQTGHLQRELADALSIDPQVLSRKLHAAKQAFLTHAEIKQIIKTLADWNAIDTQAQAAELLALMGLKREIFSDEEWNAHPLDRLDASPQRSTQDSPAFVPAAGSSFPISSTSLIGRDHEIQLLHDLLRQPAVRLLTLHGTGGVGKTRLALEAARAVQEDFAAGVFFIPLAALHDAALVPSTLVQALHLSEPFVTQNPGEQKVSSPEDLLKGFLHDKKLLLILDNVEQIPGITPFISDLLHSTADLKIMVTSRAMLHLYGEYAFDVPPLMVSSPDDPSNASLSEEDISPAVRLFVERASAVHPTYQANAQDLTIIAQICARLDGLPLAIELAAVRTKTFPLPTILQRLMGEKGQSLTFLRSTAHDISQRHQTLYKTLDWSYELLAPEQQVLFRRLSVFPAGWTLQAARDIVLSELPASTLDDVLERIESLLDHSLVKQVPYIQDSFSQELRFYLLETIREYGQGRLEESGEHAKIQRRHAIYYLVLTEDIEPELSDRTQSRAVSILAREEDNLRAALEWAIAKNEAEIAQRLCGALGMYWEARTQFREAHRWIDVVLPMSQETPPAVRGKLIMAASRLALWEVAYEQSRTLAQQALALYSAMDDATGRAWAIFQIADTWHMQGEYPLAISYFEKCLPLLHDQANWRGYAFALSRMGAMAMLQGNFSQSLQYLNEALGLLREYSEPALLNVTLVYLGVLTFVQGDFPSSIAYLREGVLLAQHTNNRYTMATALISLGCVLGVIRAPSYAARVCSAAEALFASLHTALPMAYRPLYDSYITSLKSQVDEPTWTAWWTEGSSLSLDEVCSLVLAASETTDGSST